MGHLHQKHMDIDCWHTPEFGPRLMTLYDAKHSSCFEVASTGAFYIETQLRACAMMDQDWDMMIQLVVDHTLYQTLPVREEGQQ